jgi:hypothetical protein
MRMSLSSRVSAACVVHVTISLGHMECERGAVRLDLHASLAALARRRPMGRVPEFGMRMSLSSCTRTLVGMINYFNTVKGSKRNEEKQ